MTRKCSSCSHNGHNARTCSAREVKLFGVRLMDGAIRKSASMGSLSHYAGLNIGGSGSSPSDGLENGGRAADGYASEGFAKGSSSSRAARKKGVPWTEEEHRLFLLGLKKLGKGEWRGIARNFVVSRSPAQVASHAQKYFLRQMNTSRRKRRSSLFDMVPDEASETRQSPTDGSEEAEAQGQNRQPPLSPLPDDESEPMDSSSNDFETAIPAPIPAPCTYPVVYPAYFMPVFLPAPYWPSYQLDKAGKEVHGILRPTAVHPNTPIDVNELVGMSQLSLGESIGRPPSALSLGGSDRQSAFQANPPRKDTSTNSGTSPIHAV